MVMEHRFYTLDVFTTTRFEGNPLAVITDGDGLSDDEMLAIAREMNLAETVFVQKPTEEEALARLRIFTTKEELKLAGHPVIGTWFLLAELGVVPAQDGGVHVLPETGARICVHGNLQPHGAAAQSRGARKNCNEHHRASASPGEKRHDGVLLRARRQWQGFLPRHAALGTLRRFRNGLRSWFTGRLSGSKRKTRAGPHL